MDINKIVTDNDPKEKEKGLVTQHPALTEFTLFPGESSPGSQVQSSTFLPHQAHRRQAARPFIHAYTTLTKAPTELPPEIQDIIWETCLPRRIIRDWQVSWAPDPPRPDKCDLVATKHLNCNSHKARQARPIPPIAHVCRASRGVALAGAAYLCRGQFLAPAGSPLPRRLESWVDLRRDAFLVCCWRDVSQARWTGVDAPRSLLRRLVFTLPGILSCVRAADGWRLTAGDGCMVRLLGRDCAFLDPGRRTTVATNILPLSDEVFAAALRHYDGFESGCVLVDPRSAPAGVGPAGDGDVGVGLDEAVIKLQDVWLDHRRKTSPPARKEWRSDSQIDGGVKAGALERFDRDHPWTRAELQGLVEFDLAWLVVAESTLKLEFFD